MKGLKRRAFTLVELLVVVLVLGVLAAVAAPKFKRVLETRKTTEAENMLSAIRTEQEKRCIMGKNYTKNQDKVPVLANATNSPNYTYTLGNTGVSAQGNGYELKMLSYKEGTICCSGSGCAKLNKNYTDCSTLTAPTDEECAAVVEETSETTSEPEPEPTPEPTPEPVLSCDESAPLQKDYPMRGKKCKTIRGQCNQQTGEYDYTLDESTCVNYACGACETYDDYFNIGSYFCGGAPTCPELYVLNKRTCECECACADRPSSNFCYVKTTDVSNSNNGNGRIELTHSGTFEWKDLSCSEDTGCRWKAECDYTQLIWHDYSDGSGGDGSCFENDPSFTGAGHHCTEEGAIMNVSYGGTGNWNSSTNEKFDGVGSTIASNSSSGTPTWCTTQKYKCTRESKYAYVFQVGSNIWE